MNRRPLFFIAVVVFGVLGVYWVSIGGYSLNPQTVTMSSGSTRPVANGRAQMTLDEVGLSAGVSIWCDQERRSLEIPFDAIFSEKVCGIQVGVLEVLEGRTGAPKLKLKIRW